MSKIGLVIGREYKNRVRKRTFIVLTILIPLLVVGMMFLAMWLSIEKEKHYRVLISDPADLCTAEIFIGQAENPPATFYFTTDMVDSVQFVKRTDYKEYDILIALSPTVITNKTIRGYYREEPSGRASRYIQSKIELRMEEYIAEHEGISLETYREIRNPMTFDLHSIDETEESGIREKAQVIGLIFSIFIFIFVLVYSAQVMRSVIEEKTSRVVEIIVSSVQPRKLMLGKVIGIGLVGLTQFLIWIVLIVVLMIVVQTFIFPDIMNPENWQGLGEVGPMNGQIATGMESVTEQSEWAQVFYHTNWTMLVVLFLIYFIGGYLLYGSLFAMIGSAVDSETDTQQLMLPVMMPLMFSYAISVMIMGHPDSPTAVWASQIPFSSPIIMLQRVAAGTVGLWEVILSLAILAGTFLLTIYMAGKIYRVGILMYGKKVSWKELIKWMRY